MKTVILAGGFGSRLSEETQRVPKPMVEIGGKPILWHILQNYGEQGFNDFVIACGYKAEVIKSFFANYYLHHSDWTISLAMGQSTVVEKNIPDWTISCVDTGLHTMTGGRLRRLKKWLGNETFMMTYGDGVANVDIQELVRFHKSHGKTATVTAVRPPARFGELIFEGNEVVGFSEKSQTSSSWINGGFFVLEPEIFDELEDDQTIFERSPLESLAKKNQLMAFFHEGFWQPMDTLREKQMLEELWDNGNAPWLINNA